MIIFGYKVRDKDYGAAYPVACPNCHNEVMYRGYKARRWFHIYWIPLIPGKATRMLTCPTCDSGIEIDKDELRLVKEIAEKVKAHDDDVPPDAELVSKYEALDDCLLKKQTEEQ